MNITTLPAGEAPAQLRRRLSLSLLVLYGLGVTVGAGIYVLVGLTASHAGMYTPVAFLVSALVVALTGFTYAELSTRYPVSAGEAEYVRSAFQAKWPALLVGLMVVIVGLVSSATIAIGASAYLTQFIPLPDNIMILLIILLLGAIAVWGILESVAIAGVFTLIEIAGLLFVVVYGLTHTPDLLKAAGRLVPPMDGAVWGGIASGALVAFFAYVGFEDLANVAEEATDPRRTMPRAIILTLVISTVIYLAVAAVVVMAVPMDALKSSTAPLSLVFGPDAHAARGLLNVIAGVATLNGILIQMIMASRVVYGLAAKGDLPKALAIVHPRTHTPMIATAIVAGLILVLALVVPVERLAEFTSQMILVIFTIVNVALIRLKLVQPADTISVYRVPFWVPCVGGVSCLLLLSTSFL